MNDNDDTQYVEQPSGSRSLKRVVREQAWKCERCGKQGSVPYTSDSGVWEVCNAIAGQHDAAAPECPDGKKIRLLPNDGDQAAAPEAEHEGGHTKQK